MVYCDGQFATAGAIGTSETVHFIFRNGRWEILNYDGYTTRGNQRFGCFNGYKLNDLGAPEAFRQNAYICTPAEIGR